MERNGPSCVVNNEPNETRRLVLKIRSGRIVTIPPSKTVGEIRSISFQKMSSPTSPLRRTLLIQNALNHLETFISSLAFNDAELRGASSPLQRRYGSNICSNLFGNMHDLAPAEILPTDLDIEREEPLSGESDGDLDDDTLLDEIIDDEQNEIIIENSLYDWEEDEHIKLTKVKRRLSVRKRKSDYLYDDDEIDIDIKEPPSIIKFIDAENLNVSPLSPVKMRRTNISYPSN